MAEVRPKRPRWAVQRSDQLPSLAPTLRRLTASPQAKKRCACGKKTHPSSLMQNFLTVSASQGLIMARMRRRGPQCLRSLASTTVANAAPYCRRVSGAIMWKVPWRSPTRNFSSRLAQRPAPRLPWPEGRLVYEGPGPSFLRVLARRRHRQLVPRCSVLLEAGQPDPQYEPKCFRQAAHPRIAQLRARARFGGEPRRLIFDICFCIFAIPHNRRGTVRFHQMQVAAALPC